MLFLRCFVLLALALSLVALAHPADAASKKELLDRAQSCEDERDMLRDNNSYLIKTNSSLSAQMEAEKLEELAQDVDLKSRLAECEFSTRELEAEVMGKEDQIRELEVELIDITTEASEAVGARQEIMKQKMLEEDTDTGYTEAINTLADEFAVEFELDVRDDLVELTEDDESVSFTIWNKALFSPGKVVLNKRGRVILRRAAGAIKVLDDISAWDIDIEGHTDSEAPGRSLKKRYPTNWEVSQVRAVNVLRYLVEVEGLMASSFSAVGHGEFRPIADNKTSKGRARNLRIVIRFEPGRQTAVQIGQTGQTEEAPEAENNSDDLRDLFGGSQDDGDSEEVIEDVVEDAIGDQTGGTEQ